MENLCIQGTFIPLSIGEENVVRRDGKDERRLMSRSMPKSSVMFVLIVQEFGKGVRDIEAAKFEEVDQQQDTCIEYREF